MQLTVPSAAPIQFIVRQSKSIEDREIGMQFAPSWRELADQLKLLFPDGDDEGAFARSHVVSIKDRRNGIGKPVFKLASLLEKGQTFSPVAPDLCVPGVSPEVLQRVLSLPCLRGSMCDGRLFASSPSCRLASRGASFRGFSFRWFCTLCYLLTRNVIVYGAASCSREDFHDECGRPCDALSCLLFSALWLRSNLSILGQETQSAKDIDMTCPKEVYDVPLGTPGVSLDPVFFLAGKQRAQTQISQQQQHHLMSPGGAWKGRLSSGYSGVGPAISFIWYLYY